MIFIILPPPGLKVFVVPTLTKRPLQDQKQTRPTLDADKPPATLDP